MKSFHFNGEIDRKMGGRGGRDEVSLANDKKGIARLHQTETEEN